MRLFKLRGLGRTRTSSPSNELYVGEIHWNVRSTVLNPETQKKQKRRNPEERHTIVKNAELRIIPQALWDNAQKVRSERAIHMFGPTGKPRRRPLVPRNNEHPLAGVLRCGVCNGHTRIAQSYRNGGPRAAYANAHQRGTCEHTRSFDMDVLLKDVADKMEVRLLSPKAIEEAMRAWKEERKSGQRKNSERSNLALLWHFRLGDICKEHVTVRTLSGWRSCEEVEDRLPDGRHAWLWWRS